MVLTYEEKGIHPSDMSDSESDNKHNGSGGECEKCTNPHDGKLLMQQEFAFRIDELFTMMFTNCKFNVELREIRNVTEYEQLIQWQEQESGAKCRKIKFTQGLAGIPIGPKETHVTEVQTMNACSKPGVLYSIDSVSDNADVPYADYFSICVHYCLQRVSRSSTMLSMHGYIKYKKNTMFKGFIEKNTSNGMSEYCRVLESMLNAELEAKSAAPATKRGPGRRRVPPSAQAPQEPAPRSTPPPPPRTPRWLLAAVIVLLAMNALLYFKLHYEERTADLRAYDLQYRLTSIQSAESTEWLRLLERHATRHREQLGRWREVVHTTVQRLAQTEQDLMKLLEAIKPSLESAQREAEAHT